MIEYLLYLDRQLLFFINGTLSNPVFDFVMPLFDRSENWIIPLLIVWIVLMIKDKPRRIQLAVLIPLIILLCDQTGAWIKDFGLRERPWVGLGTDLVNHLGGSGGKTKSFPSNHAANISGAAFIFTAMYPRFWKIFCSVAGVIMFSRIYIGVHYPADVLAGSIMGILYGAILIMLWRIWKQRKTKAAEK